MFYEVLGDEPVSAERRAATEQLMAANKKNENIICTSVACHLEVIPSKLTEKDVDDERQYLNLFDHVHFVDIEISTNVLMLAREIKDYYFRPVKNGNSAKMMDTVDAIHLATAIINNVDEFHTRDDSSKGSKVPLVSLYTWSGKGKVCDRYPLEIISPESPQGNLNLTGGRDVSAKSEPR